MATQSKNLILPAIDAANPDFSQVLPGEPFLLHDSGNDSYKFCLKSKYTGQIVTLNSSAFDVTGSAVVVRLPDGTEVEISKDLLSDDQRFDALDVFTNSHYHMNSFPDSVGYGYHAQTTGSYPYFYQAGKLQHAGRSRDKFFYDKGDVFFLNGLSLNDKAALLNNQMEELSRAKVHLSFVEPIEIEQTYPYGAAGGSLYQMLYDSGRWTAYPGNTKRDMFMSLDIRAQPIDCYGNYGDVTIISIPPTLEFDYNRNLQFLSEVTNYTNTSIAFSIQKKTNQKFLTNVSSFLKNNGYPDSGASLTFTLICDNFIFSLPPDQAEYVMVNEDMADIPIWGFTIHPHFMGHAKPIKTRFVVKIALTERPDIFAHYSIPVAIDKSNNVTLPNAG